MIGMYSIFVRYTVSTKSRNRASCTNHSFGVLIRTELHTMSALQYLNKKSWHTATIKNNEKKWLREQEAAKEKARIEELQKQLAEERRQEELQRLEEESGRVDPNASLKRQRLNWMYEYGRDEKENEKQRIAKEKEDVLLGKKPVDIETAGDAERAERATLVDMEAKMREDPLVQIEIQRAKLRALAGISNATTTTQDSVGSEKLHVLNNAKRDQLAQEKAQRRDERRRIRELRQSRRENRALQRQEDASVRVSGGSRVITHDVPKDSECSKGALRNDGQEAVASDEREKQQDNYEDIRQSRQTRSDEFYGVETCSRRYNSRERRSLNGRRPEKRERLHEEQKRCYDRIIQPYHTSYDKGTEHSYRNRKRYREEKEEDAQNRNLSGIRGENSSPRPRDRTNSDCQRTSRWDLGPEPRGHRH